MAPSGISAAACPHLRPLMKSPRNERGLDGYVNQKALGYAAALLDGLLEIAQPVAVLANITIAVNQNLIRYAARITAGIPD